MQPTDAADEPRRLAEAAALRERQRLGREAEVRQKAKQRLAAQRVSQEPVLSPTAAPGSAEDIEAYVREVVGRITAMKRYPEEARARGTQGTVVVMFSLGPAGQVTSAAVGRSSGDAALDLEAVSTVRRAGPFGAPPRGAPKAFGVPMRYRL